MGVCDSESVARTFYGSRNMAQMRMHKRKSALSPQRVIHPIQFMFVELNGRFRHRWPLTSSGETVPSSCCHAALIPVLPVKQSFQVHWTRRHPVHCLHCVLCTTGFCIRLATFYFIYGGPCWGSTAVSREFPRLRRRQSIVLYIVVATTWRLLSTDSNAVWQVSVTACPPTALRNSTLNRRRLWAGSRIEIPRSRIGYIATVHICSLVMKQSCRATMFVSLASSFHPIWA